MPAAHARSEAARSEILDLAPRRYSYLNRHWVLGRSGDRVFHYDYFEPGSATFSRLSVYDLDAVRWTLLPAVLRREGVLRRRRASRFRGLDARVRSRGRPALLPDGR